MERSHALPTYLVLACLALTSAHGQQRPKSNDVKVIDLDGVRRLVAERHGKVLFLNVWATWCQPCVEEFPDIERVRRSVPDSVADIAAISVDYPDEIDAKILPFLKSRDVTFPVYVSGVKKEEDFMDALNPAWSGGVPATFIFDRRGRQRAFLFGGKTFSAFKSAIDSVLREE